MGDFNDELNGVVPQHEFDLSRLRAIFNLFRAKAELKFDQLAEESGISRQTLLNISSGKYRGDLQTWIKLSLVFGVGLDEMLRGIWINEPPYGK